LQFTKDDMMRGIELGVMMLLGLVVIFLVVRPLVRRVLQPEPGALQHQQHPIAISAEAVPSIAPSSAAAELTGQMIDVAQVQGQVHAQSVHRVGELAEKNPHETVAVLRQWLNEAK
jgi:flagellar M-ring protein FliF